MKKTFKFVWKKFSNNKFQKNYEIQIHKLNFAKKFFENKILKKISQKNKFCVKKIPPKKCKFSFQKNSFLEKNSEM